MKISFLPMEALLFKLADKNTGFNASFASIVSTYGVQPIEIDFPSTPVSLPTKTFLFGQTNLEDEIASGIVKPTHMRLFVAAATNQNLEKPTDFSGLVQIGLDVIVSWLRGNVDKINFEAWTLAVEDALAQVIQPWQAQNWGAGVVYNGAFSCQRGQVKQSGQESWVQPVALRLGFQVDVGP